MLCQPKGEKMKKFKHIPLFITPLLTLFNCAPITSDMHSAKTVGKGGIEITLNSGTLDYEDAESSMSEVQDNLGAHVAYGLGEKFDIRGRFETVKINGVEDLGEPVDDVTLLSLGLKYGLFKDKFAIFLPYDIYYNSEGESGPKTLAPTIIYTKTIRDAFELSPSAKIILQMDADMDDDPWLAFNFGLGINPGILLKKVELEKVVLRAENGILFTTDSEGEAWYTHATSGLSYQIK